MYAGVLVLRGPKRARKVSSRRRKLLLERCKKMNLWPETHGGDRARKHGIEWIVIRRFKKYRVARIMSRPRGR
jgi:hypothetical protein